MRVIARQSVAKLLGGPGSGGMRSCRGVDDAPRSNLDEDKGVDSAQSEGRGNDEIAGDDRMCMVANKRSPALIVAAAMGATRAENLPDRTWRN